MSATPSLNAVGVEDQLFYNAFNVGEQDSGVSGLAAHSKPNVIFTTQVTAQTLRGTPTLTVSYPGSQVTSFNLQSFYFGCTVPSVQTLAGAATQCSILVAGFNAANKEVAVATYTFTPPATNMLNAPLIQAVLPSTFVWLHNVTIVQSSPTTQVLALDDVKYVVR